MAGQFVEVAEELGLDMQASHKLGSTGVTVGDVDLDGWPDLFVTGYREYRP